MTSAAVDSSPQNLPGQQAYSAVKRVPLSRLRFDPDNARLHPDDSIDALCKSLERFGQPEPLIVQQSTRQVVAGNGRLEAMQKIGWTHAQVRLVDWDDIRCREYSLVANRTAELSTWDSKRLRVQVEALDTSFDWDGLGFAPDDLDDLVGEDRGDVTADEIDEDEVPELPTEAITTPGTIWRLGDHILLCGDCQDEQAVQRVLCAHSADAVLTDPPYGVDYVGGTGLTIKGDSADGLRPLLVASLGVAKRLSRPGAVWYVAAPAGPQFLDFAQVLSDLEVWRQTIVWVKNSLVLGHSDYHYRHEAIFYGWVSGDDHIRPIDRKQDTIWEIDRPRRSSEHPTMKPVELYARMLEQSTRKGAVVYEPFAGSGTTLVACEQMERSCRAVEIDPRYCDVIVQRWVNLTGGTAEREA